MANGQPVKVYFLQEYWGLGGTENTPWAGEAGAHARAHTYTQEH